MGISTKASQKEIKDAYRKLALRYHPDKNPDSAYSEERFKEISYAYHVLRDPARKAQHDYALIHEASGHRRPNVPGYSPYSTRSTTYGQPQAAPWSNRPGRERNPRKNFRPAPPVDSRKNLIATAWAFGICLIMGFVVFGFSAYRSWEKEKLQQQQTELAVNMYLRAEEAYHQQNYAYSLNLLKAIGRGHEIPYDVDQLRQKNLHEMEVKANQYYEDQNFQEAATLYQIIVNYQNEYNPLVYAKLVSSYEMLRDYQHAIEIYKEVIKAEPLTIEARNRVAALFLLLKDYEQAVKYYQQANEIIVEEYIGYYGKAYALLVNPLKTPDSHYQLHCGLAHAYTELGLLKQADSAIKWAIFLRPDNPEAFFLKGNNLIRAEKPAEACKAWSIAKEKGLKEAAEKLKKNCG